jgi:hypothetical protein
MIAGFFNGLFFPFPLGAFSAFKEGKTKEFGHS